MPAPAPVDEETALLPTAAEPEPEDPQPSCSVIAGVGVSIIVSTAVLCLVAYFATKYNTDTPQALGLMLSEVGFTWNIFIGFFVIQFVLQEHSGSWRAFLLLKIVLEYVLGFPTPTISEAYENLEKWYKSGDAKDSWVVFIINLQPRLGAGGPLAIAITSLMTWLMIPDLVNRRPAIMGGAVFMFMLGLADFMSCMCPKLYFVHPKNYWAVVLVFGGFAVVHWTAAGCLFMSYAFA